MQRHLHGLHRFLAAGPALPTFDILAYKVVFYIVVENPRTDVIFHCFFAVLVRTYVAVFSLLDFIQTSSPTTSTVGLGLQEPFPR